VTNKQIKEIRKDGEIRKDDMKTNIENCFKRVCNYIHPDPNAYRYTIREFINNLKEVKKVHEDGRSKEALDEFFKLYVFNEDA